MVERRRQTARALGRSALDASLLRHARLLRVRAGRAVSACPRRAEALSRRRGAPPASSWWPSPARRTRGGARLRSSAPPRGAARDRPGGPRPGRAAEGFAAQGRLDDALRARSPERGRRAPRTRELAHAGPRETQCPAASTDAWPTRGQSSGRSRPRPETVPADRRRVRSTWRSSTSRSTGSTIPSSAWKRPSGSSAVGGGGHGGPRRARPSTRRWVAPTRARPVGAGRRATPPGTARRRARRARGAGRSRARGARPGRAAPDARPHGELRAPTHAQRSARGGPRAACPRALRRRSARAPRGARRRVVESSGPEPSLPRRPPCLEDGPVDPRSRAAGAPRARDQRNTLIAEVWPDEKRLSRATNNRLNVALSSLQLGIQGHLRRARPRPARRERLGPRRRRGSDLRATVGCS